MTTDAKERAEERERKTRERYEKCKEENASFYREMDDDKLLEEVARKFPGCSCEMCFACQDNESLMNELRRRVEVDRNE